MKAAVIVALACVAGCTNPASATRALQDAGYRDVHAEGYSLFGCGKEDTFATEFTAKGYTGRPVHGVVCEGILKGATIRSFP